MAYAGIMTTEAEIDQKTGAGVSASFTDVMKTAATLQAESTVNVLCRYNFSDAYAALSADVKYILSAIVSSLVAIDGINYDMDSYPSKRVAENQVNMLRDGVLRNMSIIRDKKQQEFMKDAT